MTQNSALTTLKDLAEKEVDDAALKLGEMRRACQQAEEQSDENSHTSPTVLFGTKQSSSRQNPYDS